MLSDLLQQNMLRNHRGGCDINTAILIFVAQHPQFPNSKTKTHLSSAVKWNWKPSLATEKTPCFLRTSQLRLQTLSEQTRVPKSLKDGVLKADKYCGQGCFNASSGHGGNNHSKKMDTLKLLIYKRLTKYILDLRLVFYLGQTLCSVSDFIHSIAWYPSCPVSCPHCPFSLSRNLCAD